MSETAAKRQRIEGQCAQLDCGLAGLHRWFESAGYSFRLIKVSFDGVVSGAGCRIARDASIGAGEILIKAPRVLASPGTTAMPKIGSASTSASRKGNGLASRSVG